MKRTIYACIITLTLFILPQIGSADRIHPVIMTTALIDVVDEWESKGILLVRRWKEPVGIALPSTAVKYGETIEDAALRGVKEETGLDATNLRHVHVYTNPNRDSRFHAIEFVLIGEVSSNAIPHPGGDAEEVIIAKYEDIPWHEMAENPAETIRDFYEIRSNPDVK